MDEAAMIDAQKLSRKFFDFTSLNDTFVGSFRLVKQEGSQAGELGR